MLHLLVVALWPLPAPAAPALDSASRPAIEGTLQRDQEEGQPIDDANGAPKVKAKAKKGPSAADERKARKSLDEAKEARAEAQRSVRYAQAELEIEELDRGIATIEIKEDLRSARAALDEAKDAVENFERVERPLLAREAEMKVEDAADRVTTAQTDLQGLEEIFAEEAEARAKPEILRRARRSLERARARHGIAKAKADLVTGHELPMKMRSLTSKVRAAEAKVASAEAKATKRRRQLDLEMEKAVDAVDDKKREARKAAAKVESLQKKLNDVREARMGKGKKRGGGQRPVTKDTDKAPSKAPNKAPAKTKGGR